jgi:hypothetical protein
MSPMRALPVAAIALVCLALAQDSARAGGPCSDSCDIAQHRIVAMSDMPGMAATSSPTPVPNSNLMSTMPANAAMHAMDDNRMTHGGHMQMTARRPTNAADQRRADRILAALRGAIAPYKDYRAAEAAGYVPFHAEILQPVYHFTNWANAAANVFSFDPARPTSLMYKRSANGYELVGAMYTAAEKSTDDQLNARVPLSIATWHLHTNLCVPPPGEHVAWVGQNAQFGLAGSITTAQACAAAGGTFKPVIYNWMVHVWPFETDPSKVWASEENPGATGH